MPSVDALPRLPPLTILHRISIMILASRSARLVAQMLDTIVAVVPVVFFALIATSGNPDSLAGMVLLPALLFAILYVLFSDCLPGGQSVGKRMLGLAVVDKRNGRPCSVGQSFVRNLLLGILGFFDWIFIVGRDRQRLGDMLAGTIVVEAATATVPYQVYQ